MRTARKNSGMTLRDIERKSKGKIANSYVSQIETGFTEKHGVNPTPQVLRILSGVLKIDYLELMIAAGHLTTQDFGTSIEFVRGN